MAGEGRLLARGRAADIFEAGPHLVLRRYREGEGGDAAIEGAVMEHARRHGFPVPRVYEARGRELLLERMDGPTMTGDLARRPWRVAQHGRALAALHACLHEIPPPSGLPVRFGSGARLVHFDFHPENVLMSRRGPVVIDWSNASLGDPADDVALTWVILATSAIPGPLPFRLLGRAGRGLLLGAYLSGVDAEAARGRLAAVARYRLSNDPHLLGAERRALEGLIRGHKS